MAAALLGVLSATARGATTWPLLAACALLPAAGNSQGPAVREVNVPTSRADLVRFETTPDDEGEAVFWLPDGADAYVVPFSAGVEVATGDPAAMSWLQRGSPWELLELPLVGARYADRTLAVIVPWPHYASLVVGERIGIAFTLPAGRHDAAPCVVLAQWTGPEPLAIARTWRQWRATGAELGVVPPPRSLHAKIEARPRVGRLLGAAHFYLWGSPRFSHHDVPRNRWVAVARALCDAAPTTPLGMLVATFADDEREALAQLAGSQWPELWLTRTLAVAIDAALTRRGWSQAGADLSADEVLRRNRQLLVAELPEGLQPPESWGDGISVATLALLTEAGIDRALLLTSDLGREGIRPDVIARAAELGFLFGPYDSYHSVHSPAAHADATWETAQFDRAAYEHGRVLNADGSGHAGFKRRGFHFAPAAAWPYVQERVSQMCARASFTAWFVDCDATGQCSEDYHPQHPATRLQDLQLRRARLRWLATEHDLVVGSEGGSALFADVIDFGHGVDTAYVGHLEPALRDRASEYYLGRHWPPEQPEQSFKPVPIAPSLQSPWFDPRLRIPLYRAAVGDEVVTSHHWSFDSLKLADVAGDRELLELLTVTPPMYHLCRGAWPARRAAIVRHYEFWSPLHRILATAPLTDFARLSDDHLLQRASYQVGEGEVTITLNFAAEEQRSYPPRSATIDGLPDLAQRVYQVK